MLHGGAHAILLTRDRKSTVPAAGAMPATIRFPAQYFRDETRNRFDGAEAGERKRGNLVAASACFPHPEAPAAGSLASSSDYCRLRLQSENGWRREGPRGGGGGGRKLDAATTDPAARSSDEEAATADDLSCTAAHGTSPR